MENLSKENGMEVKIKPRKATDRGGYYCMPLYTNIQHGKPGWRITQCPECGAKCWRIPLAEIAEKQGARGLCTMCAIKNLVHRKREGEYEAMIADPRPKSWSAAHRAYEGTDVSSKKSTEK